MSIDVKELNKSEPSGNQYSLRTYRVIALPVGRVNLYRPGQPVAPMMIESF